MTLQATSTQILVKNAAGQVKFNSSDKLLYLKASQSGTFSMTSDATQGWFFTPTISPTDIIVMKVRFTSTTGNGMPGYVWDWQTVAGSILIHTVPGSQSQAIPTQQHVLNIGISYNVVIFNKYYLGAGGIVFSSNVSFTLEYQWYLYHSL